MSEPTLEQIKRDLWNAMGLYENDDIAEWIDKNYGAEIRRLREDNEELHSKLRMVDDQGVDSLWDENARLREENQYLKDLMNPNIWHKDSSEVNFRTVLEENNKLKRQLCTYKKKETNERNYIVLCEELKNAQDTQRILCGHIDKLTEENERLSEENRAFLQAHGELPITAVRDLKQARELLKELWLDTRHTHPLSDKIRTFLDGEEIGSDPEGN